MIGVLDFNVVTLIGLHALSIGAMIGGVLRLTRAQSRRRWAGSLLVVAGLGAIFLLTWMSSRFWIGHQAIIAVPPTALLLTLGTVLLPLAAGAAVVLGVGYWAVRSVRSKHWWLGVGLPGILLSVVTAGGVKYLVALTEAQKPVPLTVESGDLKVAAGFTIAACLKTGISNPTSMAFGPDGKLYVCNLNGDVWSVADHNGVAGVSQLYSNQRLHEPVGLAWRGNDLYVASHGIISILRDLHGTGYADDQVDIATGLPWRIYDWHANNGLAFGPDGRLYFPLGATSDAAPETHAYAASILSVKPDGSELRVFATGVRNPYALAFNAAGDLFGGDNGPDEFAVTPAEKLNYYVQGGDYGFPRFFGVPPAGSGTRGPVAVFPPHASPDGIAFYEGQQFPAEYRDNAFLALFHGGEIARVQLAKMPNGDYLSNVQTLASGFRDPLENKAGPDGSLYVAEFGSGVI